MGMRAAVRQELSSRSIPADGIDEGGGMGAWLRRGLCASTRTIPGRKTGSVAGTTQVPEVAVTVGAHDAVAPGDG